MDKAKSPEYKFHQDRSFQGRGFDLHHSQLSLQHLEESRRSVNLGSAKDKTGIRNAYEQRQESTCYFNPQATTEHLRIGTNLPTLGPSVPGSVYWDLGLQCLVESATYVCSEHH